MIRYFASCAALVLALPVVAQDADIGSELQTQIDQIVSDSLRENSTDIGADLSLDTLKNRSDSGLEDITTQTRTNVSRGTGATLRALDRLTGEVSDLSVAVGQSVTFGRMDAVLGECRYPQGNASGDAYAYVTVSVEGLEVAAFTGWMVASSPALNAMDHARYDLWVLNCKTS